MKTSTLFTLGALIGTCTFSAAQEEKPARPDRPQREVPAEMLKKFDKDNDGKLSPEERKAMREERQAEMIKKYDKDGDGKLSPEEMKARDEEIAAKRKALIEKYDTNKDGRLDREETKAARDAGEEMIPMGGGRGPGGEGGRRGPGGPDGKGPDGPPPGPPAE